LTLTPPLNRGVEAGYMIIIRWRFRPAAVIRLWVSALSSNAPAAKQRAAGGRLDESVLRITPTWRSSRN